MKIALSLLFAAGLAAQPVLAQTQPELPASDASAGRAESGYGFTSGAGNGMRAEAGADMELAQLELEMPRPQTQGDVTYLCGGIGKTEASYMKQQARDYDLQLTFASRSGAYLADVDVDIRSAQGESVLQVHCGAPILLVDLPTSGTYRVQADAVGYAQSRTVRVNADSGQRVAAVVIAWPQQVVAQMEPAGPAPMATGNSGVETSGAQEAQVQSGAQPGAQSEPGSGDAGAR